MAFFRLPRAIPVMHQGLTLRFSGDYPENSSSCTLSEIDAGVNIASQCSTSEG